MKGLLYYILYHIYKDKSRTACKNSRSKGLWDKDSELQRVKMLDEGRKMRGSLIDLYSGLISGSVNLIAISQNDKIWRAIAWECITLSHRQSKGRLRVGFFCHNAIIIVAK